MTRISLLFLLAQPKEFALIAQAAVPLLAKEASNEN